MKYINEVFGYIEIYILLAAISGVNGGIVRALGKQPTVSVITLICYYCIGMPIALILGFKLD